MSNEIIHIYHTNDLHSHFENWPKIVQYVKSQKKLHEKNDEEMLLFDIGDHLDRSHPITEASNGSANITLLNRLHYHNVTIGNNEGITLIHDDLDSLYNDAIFNVLVANLFYPDGTRPKWVKPYQIHEMNCGIKIGVIGLTAAYEKFYQLLGWKIRNPFEILPELIREVQAQADVIVLLSHLGLYDDEKIATKFPEIQLILGGHTHHHLPNGKLVNQALLCGASKYGLYTGHVKLYVDKTEKKVTKMEATTIDMNQMDDDAETVMFLNELNVKSKADLHVNVAFLKENLDLDWFLPSKFPLLLADAVKEWCNAEIGMVNAGVLLESLKKGAVTKGDIHRICPHPINPCLVYLKGNELKEIILQANTDKMERLELKGFGFRGKVLGRMTFSGLDAKTVRLEDGERHVKNIIINGEPLDSNRTYSVGTLDMFTFGNLYPEIKRAEHKRYFLPEMLRDVLIWKLASL